MNAELPGHKTKIVATIGPASESPEMLVRLIRAGLDVARLNFSHGTPSEHAQAITGIRDAARETGRRVAIMADLPGPKLRLGIIDPEPIQLLPGAHFTLTSEDIVSDAQRASTSFEQLSRVVKPGDRIFLNDGLVQLVVDRGRPCFHCEIAHTQLQREPEVLKMFGVQRSPFRLPIRPKSYC